MKTIKKEFETYWTPELVHVNVNKMPIPRAAFFDVTKETNGVVTIQALIPEIRHTDLLAFCGRKTKVTIETIP